MKLITAKFNGRCCETGKAIKKGDNIGYDPASKQAFHAESPSVARFRGMTQSGSGHESSVKASFVSMDQALVEAQENSYFDSFCQHNNL
jgi:hypothetical protein